MKKGFTLIEMLITISIFLVFMGMMVNAVTLVTKNQQETNDTRKMTSDIRILHQYIADLTQSGQIDFDCYDEKTTDSQCFDQIGKRNKTLLAVKSLSGMERTIIRFDKAEKSVHLLIQERTTPTSGWISVGNSEILNSSSEIENLSFAVFPTVSPLVSIFNSDSQFQPKVSVFLSIKPKTQRKNAGTFNLQTTFSLRNL